MTAADFELVFDKEECVNKGDGRGKKRSERVLKIIEAYQIAMTGTPSGTA